MAPLSPAVTDKPGLLSSSAGKCVGPVELCVSSIDPEQLVEGPGASLSSEVEARFDDEEEDDR